MASNTVYTRNAMRNGGLTSQKGGALPVCAQDASWVWVRFAMAHRVHVRPPPTIDLSAQMLLLLLLHIPQSRASVYLYFCNSILRDSVLLFC